MSSISTSTQSVEMLALGCFDGLHLGHRELLRQLNPANSALLVIDKFQNDRLTPKECLQTLCEFELIFVDFERIKDLSGGEFLANLRQKFVNLHTLVVGEDFRFGKNRAWGAADIEKISDYEAIIVKDYEFKGISVHSKKIKECLQNADLECANALLGRAYAVCGTLIKGQGLGGKKLVPTLNLDTKNYFLPKNGVWACLCEVQNQLFKGVCFLGLRSTDGKFSVEAHILDENFAAKNAQNLEKNEKIRLIFKKFLRQNQKFEDLTLLKNQILKDCENARKCLREAL